MTAIRAEANAIDPELVVDQETLARAMYALEPISQPRLRTVFVGGFAGVALLLALVGISGVVSDSVARRVREIGVRTALGGTRTGIVQMLLVQAMTPVFVGVAGGVMGAVVLARVISAYLPEASALDTVALAGSAVILVVAAAVASLVPLWRITTTDPMAALRHE
jgi:putative ABC transport system permease protein